MAIVLADGQSRRRTVLLGLLAALGVFYLLYAALKPSAPHDDFNYYWLAGKLWANGLDPYGPMFEKFGRPLREANFPRFWAYPPNWWPISLLLSRLPLSVATYLWVAISLAIVAGSCELLRRTRAKLGLSATPEHYFLLFCFVSLSSFASTTMMWGNCALLIMGGACLVAYGLSASSSPLIITGLAVLLLKPNIGVPVAAALIVSRGGFKPAVFAGVIAALMAAPALMSTTPTDLVEGLARTASSYEALKANSPPTQTGIAHFVVLASGRTLPGPLMVPLAALSAAILAAIGRWHVGRDGSLRGHVTTMLFAGLVSAAMFLRLHVYDLAMLLPVIALASGSGITVMLLVGAGALLFFRPENLATVLQALGSPTFLPGTLPTIGLVAIYLAAILVCAGFSEVGRDRRGDASPAVPA